MKLYKIFIVTIICLVSLLNLNASNEVLSVKYPLTSNNPDRDNYQISLVKFLLDKSGYKYKIESTDSIYSQARIIKDLKTSNNINIYWMGTSPQLEKELTPIRYPIYRGLLGHRIFIINKNDQEIFDNIKTLGQLRKFKGAQGIGWSDIAILESSGLEQHATKYENIFRMIDKGGRISYFSRGLNEAFSEVSTRKNALKNITVEKNIVLVYPFAMFLFVNPKQKELAKALEKGFELSYKDGSFEKFFYNHPKIKSSIDKANLNDRVRIEIPNPFLTPQTANIDKKFWHGKFTKSK